MRDSEFVSSCCAAAPPASSPMAALQTVNRNPFRITHHGFICVSVIRRHRVGSVQSRTSDMVFLAGTRPEFTYE